MAQQYASWKTMRLTIKLTPSDTSMTGNLDVGTTSGRFYLSNNNQVEWISFSGKTANWDGTFTYTGLTRGLSQTADPITGGTGQTWLANQECILVAMHDQLVDKSQDTAFATNVSVGGDLTFPGTTTGGLVLKTLTTTQRNALTPVTGYKIYNSTTGTVQTYYGGTWNDEWNSTTPNASTTVAGKVEIATQAEVNAGTATGGTGASLAVTPDTLANATNIPNIPLLTQKTTPVWDDEYILADSESSFALKRFFRKALPFYYWDGSDGSVTVSTTISLTRDMQYSSLTVTGAWTINTRGYKIFVSWTLTNSWIIQIAHWNGGNAVVNTAWVAPATSDSWSLWNIQLGWTWAAWRSGSALTHWNSVSTTAVLFAPLSSQASNGWTGWTYGGWPYNGWTWVAWTNTKYLWDLTHSQSLQLNQLFWIFTIPAIQYSSSSGGGGWCSVSNWQSGGGGSGWNGGWCIFISAKAIINNNFIQIIGGNGGNGWNATAAATNWQADGGGGGGGGGSGWIIFLLTSSLTGTWQVISKAGNGWTGWNSNAAWGSLSLTWGGGWFGWNGWIIVSPTGNTFTVTAWTGWTGWTGLSWGGSWATWTSWVAWVVINY